MNRARYSWILAVALLWATAGNSLAVDNDAFSKPVSFLYLNSLDDSPATSPIVSKVVSYQYFDWPGDENVTFQNSAAVSFYYYNGPSLQVTGEVTTDAGVPVPGAVVTMKRYGTVFWQAATNASGTYTASGLPPDHYTVAITKEGYLTTADSVDTTAGGNQTHNFLLNPMPTALVVENIDRLLANSALRVDPPTDLSNPSAPRLKVFNGTVFIDYRTDIYDGAAFLQPTKTTLILSHGWRSNSDDWPLAMAQQISVRLGSGAVNIVAWDWRTQAAVTTFNTLPSSDIASHQGELLGRSLLQSSLTNSYGGHVHFIGHSMGTIVNATACDYVHGAFPRESMKPAIHWQSEQTEPHITLLDEAGIVPKRGINVLSSSSVMWYLAKLSLNTIAPAEGSGSWNSPIPRQYSWIDNYISGVGRPHTEAVNVELTKFSTNPVVAHGYAYQWYRDTITPVISVPAIGFDSSSESGGQFPPTGQGKLPSSRWVENLATPDPLDLSYSPSSSPLNTLNNFVLKPAENTGNAILNGYGSTIKFVGNIGGGVIYKTGNVASSSAEKIGLMWDAASDKTADVLNSISPDNANTDNLTEAVLRLQLGTFSNQPLNQQAFRGIKTRNFDSVPTSNQPPHAWFTVDVPEDAAMLAFDFTVTGEPGEDKIACAVNDLNVFTLPAKFAPDGEPVSTDLIDVSQYAGQTVELFFGLTGGTSTDCGVAIDGIRFVTIPMPQLAVAVLGDQVRLQWPAAATGWIPQRNTGLDPAAWEDVVLPEALAAADGVLTLDRPRSLQMEFFRLRRVE
jgi:hypothetical protein